MIQTKRKIVVFSVLPPSDAWDLRLRHVLRPMQADMWLRYQRMRGHECVHLCAGVAHNGRFLTLARDAGMVIGEWVDRNYCHYAKLLERYGIGFRSFASTAGDAGCAAGVTAYRAMDGGGYLSVRRERQWYCERDAMHLAGGEVIVDNCQEGSTLQPNGNVSQVFASPPEGEDVTGKHCALCGGKLVLRDLEDLCLNLEPFRGLLQSQVCGSEASTVRLEERIKQPMTGWYIGGNRPEAGVEMPEHAGMRFSLHVEKLLGYMAALRAWSREGGRPDDDWMGGEAIELVHFVDEAGWLLHYALWPVLLRTCGSKAVVRVFEVGPQRFSVRVTSKDAADVEAGLEEFSRRFVPEHLRYYSASKLNGRAEDLKTSAIELKNRVNAGLVGQITNLGARAIEMVNRHFGGCLGEMDDEGRDVWRAAVERAQGVAAAYESCDFSAVVQTVKEIAHLGNRFLSTRSPWTRLSGDPESARSVLTSAVNIFRVIAIYLQPILPAYSSRVAALLNDSPYTWNDILQPAENRHIKPYQHLAVPIDEKSLADIDDGHP